jgi:hypothetical protein
LFYCNLGENTRYFNPYPAQYARINVR